jgi:hypothetical protein
MSGNEVQWQKIRKIKQDGGETFSGKRNLIKKHKNLSRIGDY